MKSEKFFLENLNLVSFFLLLKLDNNLYTNNSKKKSLNDNIENLINSGLKNLEVSWSNNEKWSDFLLKIKLKYPKINLGSASIVNKQSIDNSIKIGLDYSMMKYWDKDLYNYAKSKNYLLIPGIQNLKDLQEAINLNCKIIKIYPIRNKDDLINIHNYKNIDFIAAGGLSISDIQNYNSFGYKAIVIGEKGYKNEKLNPKIYEWLTEKLN